MKIVSVDQMQAIEKSADAGGLSYEQMIHNAGQGIAEWVRHFLPLAGGVVGMVGSGNNGGDTLIALTALSQCGARTAAFLARDRGDDPLLGAYLDHGGQVIDIFDNENVDLFQAAIQPGTILLDGILGTGLRLPLRGSLSEVMGRIHDVVKNRPGACVVAVDCPSGMDCDTGEVSNVTLKAEHTLCMAAVKQGLLKTPGRDYAGQIQLIKIGIDDIDDHIAEKLPVMIDADLVRRLLPERPSSGYKGTFGTCQVIAGTKAFTGAAFLAGKAAYRTGSGLVEIASLEVVYQALSGRLIEAVWTVLPEKAGGYDPDGEKLLSGKFEKVDAMVIGPGFGMSDPTKVFIQCLLEDLPARMPVIFDADGLKLLSTLERWHECLPEQVILTPHPGEMAVMTGLSIDQIQTDRWGIAREYSQRWGVVLVLKGATTVVCLPDGTLFVNPVSDACLATAGSGDVLAGMIGGLLAQGM